MMIESLILNSELKKYWDYIRNASDEIKLNLISLLSMSMASKNSDIKINNNEENIDNIFGSWVGPESPEEIIKIIKSHSSVKNPPIFD